MPDMPTIRPEDLPETPPDAEGNVYIDWEALAQRLGLIQERDESAMQAWVDQAFAQNAQAVQDALGDNAKKSKVAPGYLRGQVMKISAGKADPRLAGELIERKLAELRGK